MRGGTGDDRTPERPSSGSDAFDRGVTLVEVLVTVVLLGTSVVAVIAGLGATIRGSATYENKTVTTAITESASSAVVRFDPDCAYASTIPDSLPDDGWASSVGTSGGTVAVSADCSDPDLHVVTISVVAPSGELTSSLVVTTGGPSVPPPVLPAPPPPGTVGDSTCRILSVVPDPPEMTWERSGDPLLDPVSEQLDGDVTLTVTTAGTCGSIDATFQGRPNGIVANLDPLTPNRRTVILLGRTPPAWDPGPVAVQFRHYIGPGGAPVIMNGGDSFLAFNLRECVVDGVEVSPSAVAMIGPEDPRLAQDVRVQMNARGSCDDLTVMVAGDGDAFGPVAVDPSVGVTVPGPSGPAWVPGTKSVTVTDRFGAVRASAVFVVESPVEVGP